MWPAFPPSDWTIVSSTVWAPDWHPSFLVTSCPSLHSSPTKSSQVPLPYQMAPQPSTPAEPFTSNVTRYPSFPFRCALLFRSLPIPDSPHCPMPNWHTNPQGFAGVHRPAHPTSRGLLSSVVISYLTFLLRMLLVCISDLGGANASERKAEVTQVTGLRRSRPHSRYVGH